MEKKGIAVSGVLYHLIRITLGAVFVYASYFKFRDPDTFALNLEIYTMFPMFAIPALSCLVPVIEVTLGTGVILDIKGSLAAFTLVLICFTVVLGYAIHLGLDIDCGCFGPMDPGVKTPGALHRALYRNFVMLGGILYLYLWRIRHNYSPRSLSDLFSRLAKK